MGPEQVPGACSVLWRVGTCSVSCVPNYQIFTMPSRYPGPTPDVGHIGKSATEHLCPFGWERGAENKH